MTRASGLLAALLAGLWPTLAGAGQRVEVDPTQPPWNAVAKVQTNIGTWCTGVLVAPTSVLTAAHCLYNHRTRALLQPVSLHVLFGYRRGAYRWHRLVTRLTAGPGFDGADPQPQAADWARLELAAGVPVPPLPRFPGPVGAGLAVTLAGYNQDRAQLLLADLDCRVLRAEPAPQGGMFLFHDCAGTHGASGGPLLTRQDHGWALAGIDIAAGRSANLALRPVPEADDQTAKP